MSRYTGPRLRILRALDADLPALTRKGEKRRPGRPGQHGDARRRRPSEYAQQLREKQIVRMNYGLTEGQLRNIYEAALGRSSITGDEMLSLLERRIDNAVFRGGFAPTLPAARQLVNHGHIAVDGRRLDIASARVDVGNVISLYRPTKVHHVVASHWPVLALQLPAWLRRNEASMQVEVVALPRASESSIEVDMQLVVEFYSR